jgi:hypothetical protein
LTGVVSNIKQCQIDDQIIDLKIDQDQITGEEEMFVRTGIPILEWKEQ